MRRRQNGANAEVGDQVYGDSVRADRPSWVNFTRNIAGILAFDETEGEEKKRGEHDEHGSHAGNVRTSSRPVD
jgi:hypothetical protein